MIKELQTASRVICERLRKKPYQKGVTITAWDAVIDQVLAGKRYGAFSWDNAVAFEVNRYIAELDDASKQIIWDASEDAEVIPNADIKTITGCLYPFVFNAALQRIYRAVRRKERREADQDVPESDF